MKLLLWPIFTIALYAVQTSWFHFFNTTQSPDLLLIFILLVALEQGGKGGALMGFGIGALQDVVTFSFFGYHIITRMLLGIVAGAIRGNIFKDQLPTFLVLTAIASAVVKIIHVIFIMLYQGEFLSTWPFIIDMLKYMGWNVVCAIPMWIGSKVYVEIMRRRERRYYRM